MSFQNLWRKYKVLIVIVPLLGFIYFDDTESKADLFFKFLRMIPLSLDCLGHASPPKSQTSEVCNLDKFH